MKKFGIVILVLVLSAFGYSDTKLTDEEREKAVDHLSMSRDQVHSILEGLSEEQLNFKSSPESWSVAECVEHLAISETNLWAVLEGSLQTTADVTPKPASSMSDEQLVNMISDRTTKVKTPEPFEPSGKFGSHEASLEEFTSLRDAHIEYIESTEDDLRNHYSELPFGTVDAYQVALFISAHTVRHAKQMEEIMASEGFPEE